MVAAGAARVKSCAAAMGKRPRWITYTSGMAEEPAPGVPEERAIPPYEPPPSGRLDDYERQICDCLRCRLGRTRTKFVFGEGPEGARLMFVGEAPGFHEDRQGRPFVGQSGRLLSGLLAGIGLSREEVFITNTVKCRPPANRNPLPDEIGACLPYLVHQVRLVRPKALVALGKIAGNALSGTAETLRAMREKEWRFEGIGLRVTYHPAAILRNAALLEPTREDFRRAGGG